MSPTPSKKTVTHVSVLDAEGGVRNISGGGPSMMNGGATKGTGVTPTMMCNI